MLSFLPGPLLALLAIILYLVTALLLAAGFFIVMLIWLITPIPSWRTAIHNCIFQVPSLWSWTLQATMKLTCKTKLIVTGVDNLSKKNTYLLISNHQGFLDILVLQIVLDRYIPQLRYFMKQGLFWIPIIGQACYVLGYPFMKRYSKKQIAKHPEYKGRDLETTQKACQRFANTPITLINYVEGTRFTKHKHRKKKSPFTHLLPPKAGGIAFTLSAMEKKIHTILNVTVIYSTQKHISWTFLKGKMKSIRVNIEQIPITDNLRGDYQNDPVFRAEFQKWLNQAWQEKDDFIKKTIADESVKN
jgi:1-acyl-sn-glycerol-3-phosphate acyltransferase